MKIVFTPDWFVSADVMIEVFSFLILLAFFILSIKSYKLNKKKSTLHLGYGFMIIALAQLATILTKVVLYYNTSFTQQIGMMIVTYHVVKSVDIFYYIGFFFYKLFTLLGLYIIYRIPLKRNYSGDIALAFIFIVISAFFGDTVDYVFHIVTLVLLILIIQNYYNIYSKNKSRNTLILISAFSLLALSHLIFMLSSLGALYVAGQVIQLVSYIILLVLIIKISEDGRKKEKPHRNNI